MTENSKLMARGFSTPGNVRLTCLRPTFYQGQLEPLWHLYFPDGHITSSPMLCARVWCLLTGRHWLTCTERWLLCFFPSTQTGLCNCQDQQKAVEVKLCDFQDYAIEITSCLSFSPLGYMLLVALSQFVKVQLIWSFRVVASYRERVHKDS